jgi:hypothetical protein
MISYFNKYKKAPNEGAKIAFANSNSGNADLLGWSF